MKVLFIFDIDTTLADNSERAAHLKRHCNSCLADAPTDRKPSQCAYCGHTSFGFNQGSWDAFMDLALVAKDAPIQKAAEVVSHLRKLGAPIIYLTGRNSSMESVTDAWLVEHMGKTGQERLIMRSMNAKAVPASVFKESAVVALKEEHPDTLFVFFEDDAHVFSVYNRYGLCVRCPEAWDHFMPGGLRGGEALYDR